MVGAARQAGQTDVGDAGEDGEGRRHRSHDRIATADDAAGRSVPVAVAQSVVVVVVVLVLVGAVVVHVTVVAAEAGQHLGRTVFGQRRRRGRGGGRRRRAAVASDAVAGAGVRIRFGRRLSVEDETRRRTTAHFAKTFIAHGHFTNWHWRMGKRFRCGRVNCNWNGRAHVKTRRIASRR